MKLWIDDVRPAPTGYLWAKSVNDAKIFITMSEASMSGFAACEIIDTKHCMLTDLDCSLNENFNKRKFKIVTHI